MSQHSIHTTSICTTSNRSSNVQSSRNSAYIPVTNHYNQPHVAKSLSPADINPDDIDLNHPANWGVFDDTSEPPRRPKWERKPSAATHSYPVKDYDSSRQVIPAVSDAGLAASHSSYHPTSDKHANSLYDGASLQSSPYSSTGALRLPQGSYTYTNPMPATSQPSGQGFPTPYASTHTYPSRSTAPTDIHSQEFSGRATPFRTSSYAPSRPPIPNEWHQPSSQASYMKVAPDEPRDKERRKTKKASGHSMLGGIPRDQMNRFRIVDLAPGPSSSSGSKRTRSPGSDALPDAKVRATVQGDIDGGSKGKDKAELSLEEKKMLDKRQKEADRVRRYRNVVDEAYDELRAELYPGEEKYPSVRSDHGKVKCLRDATERIRHSVPRAAYEEQRAFFEARMDQLLARGVDRDRRRGYLTPEVPGIYPAWETPQADIPSSHGH